ncbi:MAG TPA: NAD(P)-dependent oxidoreductase [Longimicrobium sp.]|nr:NAD(P)-dependent oxidoreductase [Longimicrobium sp.]
MKIAFLGLGSMGTPMARNLVRAGHDVAVWNRTRARAEPLAADGARVADSIADAVGDAEVVVTMLADDAALGRVVFAGDGLLQALAPGAVHAGMSTVGVSLSRRVAEAHAAKGQRYVAAPVFGRPEAAEGAKLRVVAAGAAEDVERCRPVFDAVGQQTIVVGEDAPGANVVKLCGNFLLATLIEALGEAYALAEKTGVGKETLSEVLAQTLFAGSPMFTGYAKQIAEERFEPAGFKLRLGLKDVRLVLGAGGEAEAPLPIASLLRDRLLASVARGRGELDWAALARLAADDAGVAEG